MTTDPIHRAFVEAGYASLGGYMKEHGEVPATAEQVPTPDDEDCWQGPEEAAHAALVAENERLREALTLLVQDVQYYSAWQRPCLALDKARAALGETP